jgi:hypothetical protein
VRVIVPCDAHQYESTYAATSVRVGSKQFKKEILSFGGPKMQNLTFRTASRATARMIKKHENKNANNATKCNVYTVDLRYCL